MIEARSRVLTTGCATRDFFTGFLGDNPGEWWFRHKRTHQACAQQYRDQTDLFYARRNQDSKSARGEVLSATCHRQPLTSAGALALVASSGCQRSTDTKVAGSSHSGRHAESAVDGGHPLEQFLGPTRVRHTLKANDACHDPRRGVYADCKVLVKGFCREWTTKHPFEEHRLA